jgi:hypothetical protein
MPTMSGDVLEGVDGARALHRSPITCIAVGADFLGAVALRDDDRVAGAHHVAGASMIAVVERDSTLAYPIFLLVALVRCTTLTRVRSCVLGEAAGLTDEVEEIDRIGVGRTCRGPRHAPARKIDLALELAHR